MRCVSLAECEVWTRDRGVLLRETASSFSAGATLYHVLFSQPAAARVQIALSQALVEALPDDSTTLLWMTDWPLYKAHEMALVTRIRAGFGESRLLKEAPGHIFEPSDRDLLAGLLTLVLAFGWDAYVVPGDGTSIFFACHHDLFEVFSRDEKLSRQIRELLITFGITAE